MPITREEVLKKVGNIDERHKLSIEEVYALNIGDYILAWQLEKIYGYTIWLSDFDLYGGNFVKIVLDNEVTLDLRVKIKEEYKGVYIHHKDAELASGKVFVIE